MSETTGSSRTIVILALVMGLAVGLGAAFFLGRGSGGEDRQPVTTGSETRDGDAEALAELPEPDQPIDPSEADEPEQAIRGYLAAEVAGDWEDSYEFLTDDLRQTAYTTPAAWVNAHADVPTITGYRVDDVTVDEEAGRASVRTLTGFESAIDPVLGLVAARGRTRWTLQRDDEGLWRVNATATENQPLYPNSDGAAEAVRGWVDARVACEDTTTLEEGLIGTRALATRLCEEDQPDDVAIGQIGPLADSADAAALLSQFGPGVYNWARAARVDATTPLTAVLGPVGGEWKVVAVIGPGV